LGRLQRLFKKTYAFASALVNDERVPKRDRVIIAGMLAYLLSPLDLIPDFIPVIGQLDDLVVVIVLLDYVFHHLDRALALEHWPWSARAFDRTGRIVHYAALVVPGFLRRKLWQAGTNSVAGK
jgi:uncharacterized membrane protein YkvA (DUF1232 family)